MPGVQQRGGRRRRTMNEINMVPFIDVMLVLLIIFMVTAPLITTGVVDLPSVGKAQQREQTVIEIVVGADAKWQLRAAGGDLSDVAATNLVARVRAAQAGNANVPVVIAAERSVRYEEVVRVMDLLQRAGVQRVGLAVKQGG